MAQIKTKLGFAPLLLVLAGCIGMPVEQQSEELRLLLGEIQAREQVLDKRQNLLQKRASLLASLELQQEGVAERSGSTEIDLQRPKANFLAAPDAVAGQCFRLGRIPPRLSAEPQTVVMQDAADQIIIEEPIFSDNNLSLVVDYEPLENNAPVVMQERVQQVQIRPGYRSWEPIAASFENVNEPLLTVPAHQDFVPCEKTPAESLSFTQHWCALEKAAEYSNLQRRAVTSLSSVREITVAAEEIAVVIREPQDPAAKASMRPISRQIERQKIQQAARYRREVLLPEFKTVTVRQLTRPASLSWQQVVCADNLNDSLLKSLQQALNGRGYEAGEADGNWGEKTAEAVRRFRADKMLPDLGADISLELLRQIELPTTAL